MDLRDNITRREGRAPAVRALAKERTGVLRKLSNAGDCVRDLQKKLGKKAQAESGFRFYALYDKVYRWDVLVEAWRRVRRNGGASGIDGQSLEDVEKQGAEDYLKELQESLRSGSYRPQAVRRVYIAKPDGRQRPLGIPCVVDRIVQQATLIVLEPIFEADFTDTNWGFRPGRSAQQAAQEVVKYLNWGLTQVCDVDIDSYFDSIPHDKLMTRVAQRIVDRKMLGLIQGWLSCAVEEEGRRWKPSRGVPQGGVISPLLANIYLHVLDAAWKRRGYTWRDGPNVQIVRYADDLVLLTNRDAHWAQDRLREILDRLDLQLNEGKSRIVDAEQEPFDFLGFTYRRVVHRKTRKRITLFEPSKKAQKRLRQRVKQVLNPMAPVAVVERIGHINTILRGWVNYFWVGNSSRVFHHICWYVEVKVRRLLQRKARRYGCGWKRYDYTYLYETLGLFHGYRVRWQPGSC